MFYKQLKKLFGLLFILLLGLMQASCKVPDDEDKPPITVEELTTEYTDAHRLTTDYTGKYFTTYGIGKVTLVRVVDGDTAHFSETGKDTIKIRFLGVNTPESTIRVAPWGFLASAFVSNKLEHAYEIVIEANEIGVVPPFDTTGERYLGYIWYRPTAADEFRLLNLEIIEQCFSYFTGGDAEKYFEVCTDAFWNAYSTHLRVFGEKDPNFDYSTEIYSITIAELRNNYSNYSSGTTLKIKARVIRKVGKSLYIEDLDETVDGDTELRSKAGIFLYDSFVSGLEDIEIGDVIEFNCQATDTAEYGSQLVNPHKIRIRETKTAFDIREADPAATVLDKYEGLVVKVFGVAIEYVGNPNEKGAYTIRGTLENGAEIQIRVDADVSPKLSRSYIVVGHRYDITGGISKYIDVYNNNKIYYQIKLGNLTADTNDFVESEDQ